VAVTNILVYKIAAAIAAIKKHPSTVPLYV